MIPHLSETRIRNSEEDFLNANAANRRILCEYNVTRIPLNHSRNSFIRAIRDPNQEFGRMGGKWIFTGWMRPTKNATGIANTDGRNTANG